MRLIFFLCAVAGLASAEPKVRIFVTESGAMMVSGHSMSFTGPTSSENIEVMKAFQKHCPSVAVTSDREKADYIVRLDREGPSPVTPFVRGNKVAVFNKDADLVFAQSNRTLAPAVKGACAAVMAKR